MMLSGNDGPCKRLDTDIGAHIGMCRDMRGFRFWVLLLRGWGS